jgi:hypothetical protein
MVVERSVCLGFCRPFQRVGSITNIQLSPTGRQDIVLGRCCCCCCCCCGCTTRRCNISLWWSCVVLYYVLSIVFAPAGGGSACIFLIVIRRVCFHAGFVASFFFPFHTCMSECTHVVSLAAAFVSRSPWFCCSRFTTHVCVCCALMLVFSIHMTNMYMCLYVVCLLCLLCLHCVAGRMCVRSLCERWYPHLYYLILASVWHIYMLLCDPSQLPVC